MGPAVPLTSDRVYKQAVPFRNGMEPRGNQCGTAATADSLQGSTVQGRRGGDQGGALVCVCVLQEAEEGTEKERDDPRKIVRTPH